MKSKARSKIRFRNGKQDKCYQRIRQRVAEHFSQTGKSRYANTTVVLKAALFGSLAAASYGLIVANIFSAWSLFGLAITFGLSSLLLAINVSHDAAHHALAPNRKLNDLIHVLLFSLLGSNAYLWQMRHVGSHHVFPNVSGCDADIDHNPIIRLSPNQPRRPINKYQHLYAPFVYLFVHLHTIFVQDFVYLFKKNLANMRDITHSTKQYAVFILAKITYFVLVLVVPLAVLDLPWWQVLFGYAIMTFLTSVVFVILLIGTHFAVETEFPEVDGDGRLPTSWAEHVFVTSLDWSPTSRIANFIVGGANAHVAHHLFPGVCHIHYVDISLIICRAAKECGVKYNQTTFLGLIKSHLRFLRVLGQGPPQTVTLGR